MEPIVLTAAGIVSALAALAGWLITKAWPALRKIAWFVDDLVGEPGRPGVPARPGFSERMATLEKNLEETKKHMASVRFHVQNDHHTNLRDDVDGIRDRLEEHVAESAPLLEMTQALYAEWGQGPTRKRLPLGEKPTHRKETEEPS